LTEEEIEENQKMWFEEREEPEDSEASGSDLRSIGISQGDMEADADTLDEIPDDGAEQMPPDMAGQPAVGAPADMSGMSAPPPVA